MLGLLLLLQVLASCLWLGHSEVVKNFINPCVRFFYAQTPPSGGIRPTNASRICQVYKNKYRFVTLYDRNNRIPVYSAYIYQPGNGKRYESWFIEPQLINQKYRKDMDEEDSIVRQYKINSTVIAESQAIDKDYSGALDRGHLCPSGHQSGDDNKTATFTLTNIVPQYSTLNQGAWRIYEEETMAQKTQGCDITYVITGAVPGKSSISNGRVNVPSHIWSAACCLNKKKPIKAWAAMAENMRDRNHVRNLDLVELTHRLATLYGRGGITLFKNSCTGKEASHP
ncbi:endonuclease domain-containing 1 protein-like [Catharus ustulatus]|uniref:endonuclease domain-containing 1 protein-like n=1 Tax=Catharus ustulatus TaxID=91951 RepID=UPI00140E0242|nr:endonuclease domain-containing 1 protein-like [Catharus ustulatus]